jgi:hypothetical protein
VSARCPSVYLVREGSTLRVGAYFVGWARDKKPAWRLLRHLAWRFGRRDTAIRCAVYSGGRVVRLVRRECP